MEQLGNEKEKARKRILLADDDPSLRRLLEVILRRAGYEVTSTEDGLSAMKIALEKKFDLVVADAVMPNLGGFDLCRILRYNSDYAETFLVILSGMELKLNEENKNLADAYLLKGENLKEQLVEIVSNLLAEKKTDKKF